MNFKLISITMYAASWCGDCYRVKRYLDQHAISYAEIDIDVDSAAAAYVEKINHGYRSVPTLVFKFNTPTGIKEEVRTEPNIHQLEIDLKGWNVLVE